MNFLKLIIAKNNMTNQPIEEKWNWREEFDEKFDIGPLFEKENGIRARAIYGGKEIKSFIENLLEQERKRMSEEVEKFMPADREVNYHSSYSEGKIDMAEKILSIIKK